MINVTLEQGYNSHGALTIGDGAMYDTRNTTLYPLGLNDALDAAIEDIRNGKVIDGVKATKIVGQPKMDGTAYSMEGCTRRNGGGMDIRNVDYLEIDLSWCKIINNFFIPSKNRNITDWYRFHAPIVVGSADEVTPNGPNKIKITVGEVDNAGTDGNFICVLSRKKLESCEIHVKEFTNWSNSQSGGTLTAAGDQQGLIRIYSDEGVSQGIDYLKIKIDMAKDSVFTETLFSSQFVVNLRAAEASPIKKIETDISARNYHGSGIRFNTDGPGAILSWHNKSDVRYPVYTKWPNNASEPLYQEHQAWINDKNRGGVTHFVDSDDSFYLGRDTPWTPAEFTDVLANYGTLQIFNTPSMTLGGTYMNERAPFAIGFSDGANPDKSSKNIKITANFIGCASIGDLDDYKYAIWDNNIFERMNIGSINTGYGSRMRSRIFNSPLFIDCYTYDDPDRIVDGETRPEDKFLSVVFCVGPVTFNNPRFEFTPEYATLTAQAGYQQPKYLFSFDGHISDAYREYIVNGLETVGLEENTNIEATFNIAATAKTKITNCKVKLNGTKHIARTDGTLPVGIMHGNYDMAGNPIDNIGTIHAPGLISETKDWFYAGSSNAYNNVDFGTDFNSPWLTSTTGYLTQGINTQTTEWLQMNLIEASFVESVAMTGRADAPEFTQTCEIQYSLDNTNWVSLGIKDANTDSTTIVYVPVGVIAKHIRVIPRTWQTNKAMRATLVIGDINSLGTSVNIIDKGQGSVVLTLDDISDATNKKFLKVESTAASQTITLPATTSTEIGNYFEVYNYGSEIISFVSATNSIESVSTDLASDAGAVVVVTGANQYTITGTGVPETSGNTAVAILAPQSTVFTTTETEHSTSGSMDVLRKQINYNNQSVPVASPTGKKWIVQFDYHARFFGPATVLTAPVNTLISPSVQYSENTINGADAQSSAWNPIGGLIDWDYSGTATFEVPKAEELNWVAGIILLLRYVDPNDRPTYDIDVNEIGGTLTYKLVDA